MSPGDHLPADKTEVQSDLTKVLGTNTYHYFDKPYSLHECFDTFEGSLSVKPAQEILSARDPISRGNAAPPELISAQPLPAAAPPAGALQEVTAHQKHQNDPTCPQCSLTIPDQGLLTLPGSRMSMHSSRTRNSVSVAKQPATTQSDSGFRLLLACLWCQCSVLLLGLLEACSSCLHALCSSCCRACTRCCSAIQDAPVEELNCHAHCHSVLFESCCEPTECLELCLECCELCHRS